MKSIKNVSEPPCGELTLKNIDRYLNSEHQKLIESFIDSLSDFPDQKETHQAVFAVHP